jgi:hypothetical protein
LSRSNIASDGDVAGLGSQSRNNSVDDTADSTLTGLGSRSTGLGSRSLSNTVEADGMNCVGECLGTLVCAIFPAPQGIDRRSRGGRPPRTPELLVEAR